MEDSTGVKENERMKLCHDYMTEEGYTPRVDKDGDLVFKYEGGTYCLVFDRDEEFFRIVFPNFWSVDSEEERRLAERTCVKTTARVKVAKVFIVKDNVQATIEAFSPEPQHFMKTFRRSLGAIQTACSAFSKEMRQR